MSITLEFEEILKDTVVEAGKSYGKAFGGAAAEQALTHASEFVRDVAAETVGIFLGTVAKVLLQTILKRETAIAAKLDTLIREPALTGIKVGFEVISQNVSSEVQRMLRQTRLNFAVEKLDVARTLSCDSKDMQHVLVTLLQGFFLTQLDGGEALARARFEEVRPALLVREAMLSKRAIFLCNRARNTYEEADREQAKADHYGERAADVFIDPRSYSYQARILRAAAALNGRECKQAKDAWDGMRKMIEIIGAYSKRI